MEPHPVPSLRTCPVSVSCRPSRLWLRRRTRPPTPPRTWTSPAPTACPRPLRSLSTSSWRPRTGVWGQLGAAAVLRRAEAPPSACRHDGHQNNLRSAAYEALMEIVKNSAKDCYPAVQRTTLVIMERLQQVLQMEVSASGHAYRSRPRQLCPTTPILPGHARSEPLSALPFSRTSRAPPTGSSSTTCSRCCAPRCR